MLLTTPQIKSIFADEIAKQGGKVHDAFDDGAQLFARSVLPGLKTIRWRDKVQGGVAIRATDDEITVHPYTFRLICSNGAIMAHAVQTRRLVESDLFTADQTEESLREAVQLCCAAEAFTEAAKQMRDATTTQVDYLLMIAQFLSRMPHQSASQLLHQLMPQLTGQRRGTRYDLMNVITATARDTRDPETKWQLETVGGAVAAGIVPPSLPTRSARTVERELLTA